MSYYMGDYYRGDPGFWSFLGGIAKSAVGAVPVVGPTLSSVLSTVGRRAAPIVSRAAPIVSAAKSTIIKHPVLTAAGAAGAVGAVGAGAKMMGSRAAAGAASSMRVSGGRRHKRMNVCNPRALRRAIRRTHGFARLAMKTIHIVHPKKKGTFGGFKKKRKR